MVFEGMEFYNVEEMVPSADGYRMCRLPLEVSGKLAPGIRDATSFHATGMEIRFFMLSDEVKLHLSAEWEGEAQIALIYFGSVQGGWNYSSRTIKTEDTVISIRYPEEVKRAKEISGGMARRFDPKLVRVILPNGACRFLGKEGSTAPPGKEDVPACKYLAYGSSITHGSLSILPPWNYVSRIADHFGFDAVNQGYAGSAFMEKPMAEYIVKRTDWTFASVELGVNLVKEDISEEEYEERAREFLEVLAADSRPVFVTDIFTNLADRQERTRKFRKIVEKYAREYRLTYTPGTELLPDVSFLSGDLLHPSYEGQREIAANWIPVMESCGIKRARE